METKNRVKSNFIYNMLAQVVVYLVPLISTPYVSRVLGANHIGEYSYAISIVTYFSLFASLGSSMYGQRKIAFCRNDSEELSQAFWDIFSFRAISAAFFSLLYLFLVYHVFGFSLIRVVTVLNIIDVCVDITWFYQGIEDFRQTLLNRILVKIVGFICLIIFVRSADDTWKYALIMCGSTVLGNLALWVNVPNKVGKPRKVKPFINFKGMWLIFLPTIATQVYLILDKSMIGWITGSDYFNGCYEQSEKLVRASIVFTTSLSTVIFPRIANLFKNEDSSQIKHYIYLAYRVVLMLAVPIMLGFISVSDYLIPLYLGEGYDLSIELLVIFSFLVIPVSLASITGLSYLVATNQQNVYTFSVTVSAICNFTMNMILIRKYGAVGAAIASVVAEIIGAAIQIFYCVRTKQLNLEEIFLPSYKYLISGIIMFSVVMFLKSYFECSIKYLLFLVIIGMILYFSILFVLKDELFIDSYKKLRSRFVGRFKR